MLLPRPVAAFALAEHWRALIDSLGRDGE